MVGVAGKSIACKGVNGRCSGRAGRQVGGQAGRWAEGRGGTIPEITMRYVSR